MTKYFYDPKVRTFAFALMLAIGLFYISQFNISFINESELTLVDSYLDAPSGLWKNLIDFSRKISYYN